MTEFSTGSFDSSMQDSLRQYAEDVLHMDTSKDLTHEEQVTLAHAIIHITDESIKGHPQEQTIQKIRDTVHKNFDALSTEVRKADKAIHAAQPDGTKKWEKTSDKVDQGAGRSLGIIKAKIGTFWGEFDLRPAPSIIGATFGMFRSIGVGVRSAKESATIRRLEKQMVSQERETPKGLVEYEKLKAKLEASQQNLQKLKGEVGIVALAVTSSGSTVPLLVGTAQTAKTAIGSNIGLVAQALAAKAAFVFTGAVGAVLWGSAMLGTAIVGIKQSLEKSKKFDNELRNLGLVERETGQHALAKNLIEFRRDNIVNTQKKSLSLSHIKNALYGSSGGVATAGGIMLILAKLGIAISIGAIASTGVGLGIMIGVAIAAAAGIALYKYYKKSQAGVGKIIELQTDIGRCQKQIQKLLKSSDPNAMHEVALLNETLLEKTTELQKLKLPYQVIHEASAANKQKLMQLFTQIDDLNEKSDLTSIQRATGIKMDFLTENNFDNSSKEKLKEMLVDWITAKEAHPI